MEIDLLDFYDGSRGIVPPSCRFGWYFNMSLKRIWALLLPANYSVIQQIFMSSGGIASILDRELNI